MRCFDRRRERLDLAHILASGALPPAFPAVRIDGELYRDGRILSNAPTEIIFDEYPRQSSIIFAVHMWTPLGAEPETIWEVLHRHKDIQYSSRIASHIARQQQMHKMRHIIEELVAYIPEVEQRRPELRALLDWGCPTRMHVVRLLAPSLEHEDQTKDVDFSVSGIRRRWQAGYEHCRQAIERAPWRGEFDPLEGASCMNNRMYRTLPRRKATGAPFGSRHPARVMRKKLRTMLAGSDAPSIGLGCVLSCASERRHDPLRGSHGTRQTPRSMIL